MEETEETIDIKIEAVARELAFHRFAGQIASNGLARQLITNHELDMAITLSGKHWRMWIPDAIALLSKIGIFNESKETVPEDESQSAVACLEL